MTPPPPVLYDQFLRIIEAEWELDITMFSVAINGTLHYKSSFTEHIAMVQSNEDARISVFNMSEMRLIESQSSDSTKSKQNVDVFWLFYGSSHYNL